MYGIKDNTEPNFLRSGWNIMALLAFLVSAVSLVYTKITYDAQKKTEGNTKKLSQDAQRELLYELLRHLYRNYVIIYTMRTKMKEIHYRGYPSEEHFQKLKIPMENIHLEAFYGEDEKFQRMHVLYLNLRNYNEEIEVALKHMVDPSLSVETKNEDFDTLEFKVFYLTGKIIDTVYKIWIPNKDAKAYAKIYRDEMRKALALSTSGETNATDNIDVPNSGDFEPVTIAQFRKSSYAKLYNEQELEKICITFNKDVHEERKRNNRGAWKVRMILEQHNA